MNKRCKHESPQVQTVPEKRHGVIMIEHHRDEHSLLEGRLAADSLRVPATPSNPFATDRHESVFP